jgi:hypothetical protein
MFYSRRRRTSSTSPSPTGSTPARPGSGSTSFQPTASPPPSARGRPLRSTSPRTRPRVSWWPSYLPSTTTGTTESDILFRRRFFHPACSIWCQFYKTLHSSLTVRQSKLDCFIRLRQRLDAYTNAAHSYLI